jgi:prolyl-tRNA editing enzyme YbaK/EbsC (Cys-tRNA(Pro) deacylase)
VNNQKLTTADLQAFCQTNEIEAQLIHLSMPTPTVLSAAQAVGCEVEQIVKSVLFLANDQPVLAIANGEGRIRPAVLADYFEVSNKRVRLARPAEVLEHTGYEAGALPPFGHRQLIMTFLEPRILTLPLIYAGGGDEYSLLRLKPIALQQAVPLIPLEMVEH